MSGYRLAVDYGTSFTAAATADGSAPEVLEFSSARHSRYLPSLVLVDQRGELHVGTRAVAKRGAVPADHVCAAPKRRLGSEPLTLGSVELGAADVVAATLAKVAEEARHQHNGEAPEQVVMTHPALWAAPRCEVLRDAVVKAGLADDPSTVRLVPEPVAAVTFYAAAGAGPDVAEGESVAVYDLGGGTFDCAVLSRTATGWDLGGPPGGDERLGGEDFDEALLEWVGDRLRAEDPEAWGAFEDDDSPRGRSDWVSLLELIRSAKEELSSEETTEVGLPPGPLPLDSLLINRAEFTALIGQALDRSMRAFARCLEQARVAPGDLRAIYLTGGSSRIPAVKGELHRRFGIEPTTYKDPKSITALGALLYDDRAAGKTATVGADTPRDASVPEGDESHVDLRSAHDLRAALELAAAMAGGTEDPIFDNVGLSVGAESLIIGGNESRVAFIEVGGGGDECDRLFAPQPVIDWLGTQPADGPVEVVVRPDDVSYRCGGGGITVPAVAAQHGPAWADLDTLAITAEVDFTVGAARSMLAGMRQRREAALPLVLSKSSVVVGGYPLAVKAKVDAAVSGSLPREPLIAVLEYVVGRSGAAGKVNLTATSDGCLLAFQHEGMTMVAAFRRDAVATTGQPPSPGTGTSVNATVCVTPKAAYGGVGSFGVGFRIKVDGREIPTKKWEPLVFAVPPGSHTIECYCTDFARATSRAQVVISASAGQRVNLLFKQAPTTLQRGKLTIV